MTKQEREMRRVWLSQACGVGLIRVTDEHVARWEKLNADIRAYEPTEEQARSTRSMGHREQVIPEGDLEPSVTFSNSFHGPRQKLRGEP